MLSQTVGRIRRLYLSFLLLYRTWKLNFVVDSGKNTDKSFNGTSCLMRLVYDMPMSSLCMVSIKDYLPPGIDNYSTEFATDEIPDKGVCFQVLGTEKPPASQVP